ncbi:MAG: hypothetical protein P4L98_05625 [Ancalomicrobiaceae bacterium]|nr:hypothetical protein [Ancalomicrobiaceae bacterium]
MISVRLDTREFSRALEKLAKELPKQLAGAVNRTARASRTAFNKDAARDIGVSPRKLKFDSAKELTSARADFLEARFRPSPKTVNLVETNTVRWKGRGSPLTASTNTLTGGGSSHLHALRGVLLKSPLKAYHRIGKGKTHSVKGLKQLYTTSPRTLMAQRSHPRAIWMQTANERLEPEVVKAVETAAARAGFAQ